MADRTKKLIATALFFSFFSTASDASQLKVVVTIKPVHALVHRIMTGIGEPHLLVSGSASPHNYAMKPSDAKAVQGADVFLRVSEEVEPFTAKIMKSLPKTTSAITLSEASGVELLKRRTGTTFEPHAHQQHPRSKHAHGRAHGDSHGSHDARHETRHDAHDDAADGHVWLDPQNARAMAAEIARVLSERAPQHADRIKVNAQALDEDLRKLSDEITETLKPVAGKPFIVFHDAYQYFERRFGVEAAGSITVSTESQPSAKRLTEIRAKIARLGAACVFTEPGVPARLSRAATEGTKARGGELDPEGLALEPGPGAYHQLLRNLAGAIKTCLAHTG